MKLPSKCPSCEQTLSVSELKCEDCQTVIRGSYQLPLFTQLTPEEQNFILQFFLHSGSIKEMAAQAGISYPTMRNKLDDLINKIKSLQP